MWPFRAPVLEATSVCTHDPAQGIYAVSFRDTDGHEIDGSAGVDALLAGFHHRGRKVRLVPHTSSVLATLVERGGGRYVPGVGFLIPEEELPEALRAFRTLPERQAPVEDAAVRAIEIDARAVELCDAVELVADEQLRRETTFRDAEGARGLPVAEVVRQRDRTWVRHGNAYFKRPKLTARELDEVAAAPNAELINGDDVPYFLAKQLEEARRAGRRVVLGPRASKAQVLSGEWLPEVVIDLENERLRLDVGFKAGSQRIPLGAAVAAGKRRFVPVARDTWARNDRAARKRVEEALDEIPDLRRQDSGLFDAPPSALPVLQERFSTLGTIRLSESARALRDKLLDFKQIERVAPPKALRATLRSYQQHGLDWLCFLRKFGLSGILADDMGLGKTIQTLAAILASHEAGQQDASLVVCPASVLSVWEREVQKWCEGVRPVVLTSQNRDRYLADFPPRTVAIASYASVARHADAFGEKVWNYVVLDEAHRVKNHTTASAKACKALLARHKLAVTGTPIQNRLRDVWALYDSIMPGHLGSDVATFTRNFEVPIEKDKSEEAAAQLRRRIDPFKLRRLKSEVAKDLPPLEQQLRTVRMLDEQRVMYRQLVNQVVPQEIEALRDAARRGSPLAALEKLLRLRQICAHPRLIDETLPLYDTSAKFEEFRDLLDDSLAGGHKVLVFTQWKQMADLIAEHLALERVPHAMLDGSVPSERRAELVRAFQQPDGPPVLIVSLLAGGEGITLTEADTVIMYDRWWNPAIEDQAIARAHRIGQTRPVTAYILETDDSIEQRLAAMLGSKKQLGEELIHVDDAQKRIDRDDLLAVLQDELVSAQKSRG